MLSTSFRNTLIASTLLVGASILTGTAAFAADPTDSGIVGGDVADISTMTFTDPSAPGSTTLATGSGFAMGSLAIRNNDPQGWTLKVQSTIAVLGGMRYVQRPVTLIQQGSSCTSFDQEPL